MDGWAMCGVERGGWDGGDGDMVGKLFPRYPLVNDWISQGRWDWVGENVDGLDRRVKEAGDR